MKIKELFIPMAFGVFYVFCLFMILVFLEHESKMAEIDSLYGRIYSLNQRLDQIMPSCVVHIKQLNGKDRLPRLKEILTHSY